MPITWKSNQELTDQVRAIEKEIRDIKEFYLNALEERLIKKIEIYMNRLSIIENRLIERMGEKIKPENDILPYPKG